MGNASRDENYVTTLLGVSTADGETPVPLEVDPNTGQLQVSGSGGGGGSDTQYTSGGTTPVHPIGTMPVFDNGGTVVAVSAANPLPVNASVTITGGATAGNQTNGTQQSKITDGTNIANVLAAGTANSTGNGLMTAGMGEAVTFSTTTVQVVGSTDVGNYGSVSVQINTQGTSSSITFQGSNDNTNWFAVLLISTAANNSPGVSSIGSTGIYVGALKYRYFRLNVTGISAGTTSGVIWFDSLASTFSSIGGSVTVNSMPGAGTTGNSIPSTAVAIGINDSLGDLRIAKTMGFLGNDSASADNFLAASLGVYNSSTYDRLRAANTAANTTGVGLLGTGLLGYDGTNWQYAGINASHALKVDGSAVTQPVSLATTAVTQATAANLNATVVGTVGTTSSAVNVGQKTVNTTAVQISSSSTIPTNGIIIKALSTNSASVFVGGSGVTTSTGYELVAGESISFTCNLSTLYIISVASTTDKICWNVE